jgi:DNA primase
MTGWKAELEEAEQDLTDDPDEAMTWRLGEAAKARAQAGRRNEEEDADFALGDNGAHIDKDEKNAFDSLLKQIRFDKGRG